MRRGLAFVVWAAGMWAAGCAATPGLPPSSAAQKAPPAAAEATVVRCPVTGEEVPNPAEAMSSVHEGVTYYFCCPPCKIDFDKDPAKYIKRP